MKTIWTKIKWTLFGETRLLIWYAAILVVIALLMLYPVIHIIIKYW